eukprot:TRINITY_DN1657_c0_g2_i1.p1 TRINITY_DN1657_c0_g2~~TRINITY_DN1657_c0_g2_i1.p1  ORF type:complete len:796 (+),score=273.16 TRINITY_DN1657_c0_g2_i1:96-2390(+)
MDGNDTDDDDDASSVDTDELLRGMDPSDMRMPSSSISPDVDSALAYMLDMYRKRDEEIRLHDRHARMDEKSEDNLSKRASSVKHALDPEYRERVDAIQGRSAGDTDGTAIRENLSSFRHLFEKILAEEEEEKRQKHSSMNEQSHSIVAVDRMSDVPMIIAESPEPIAFTECGMMTDQVEMVDVATDMIEWVAAMEIEREQQEKERRALVQRDVSTSMPIEIGSDAIVQTEMRELMDANTSPIRTQTAASSPIKSEGEDSSSLEKDLSSKPQRDTRIHSVEEMDMQSIDGENEEDEEMGVSLIAPMLIPGPAPRPQQLAAKGSPPIPKSSRSLLIVSSSGSDREKSSTMPSDSSKGDEKEAESRQSFGVRRTLDMNVRENESEHPSQSYARASFMLRDDMCEDSIPLQMSADRSASSSVSDAGCDCEDADRIDRLDDISLVEDLPVESGGRKASVSATATSSASEMDAWKREDEHGSAMDSSDAVESLGVGFGGGRESESKTFHKVPSEPLPSHVPYGRSAETLREKPPFIPSYPRHLRPPRQRMSLYDEEKDSVSWMHGPRHVLSQSTGSYIGTGRMHDTRPSDDMYGDGHVRASSSSSSSFSHPTRPRYSGLSVMGGIGSGLNGSLMDEESFLAGSQYGWLTPMRHVSGTTRPSTSRLGQKPLEKRPASFASASLSGSLKDEGRREDPPHHIGSHGGSHAETSPSLAFQFSRSQPVSSRLSTPLDYATRSPPKHLDFETESTQDRKTIRQRELEHLWFDLKKV